MIIASITETGKSQVPYKAHTHAMVKVGSHIRGVVRFKMMLHGTCKTVSKLPRRKDFVQPLYLE